MNLTNISLIHMLFTKSRSDLEKWYTLLVAAMISSINRLSREHTKTPAEVIKMENFHHLFALLSR